MIDVQITKGSIKATGHAYYGPVNCDIVCAGFSILVQTLIESLERINEPIKYKLEIADIEITYKRPSKRAKTLIGSFLVGVELLESKYPIHIKLSKH